MALSIGASMKHGKKKKRRSQSEPLSSADKAIPLTPDEFFFAMRLGSAAFSFRMPMKSPSNRSLKLREEDDSVTELRFWDVPLNRMGFALAEHFEDGAKFTSFMYRFWALSSLQADPLMSAYRKEDPESDQVGINSAVLETAAVHPLRRDGCFDPDAFFMHVADIVASGKYEDLPKDDHSR